MTVTLTYHSHSTFSLDINGTKLIVDPFLKGNNPLAETTADEIDVEYILLTHGHSDHTADALAIAQRCNATIIANFEICGWYNTKGHEKTHPQHLGGGFNHPFGHLKLTVALHGSSMPDGAYGGMPAGLLLTVDGKKIYIAGDTALFSDMQLIGEAGLDLAIVPIGDNFTMGPDDALKSLAYLKPNVVIPCHYNTFGYIEVDEQGWADRVNAETETTAVVLGVDQSYTLP